MHGIIVWQFPYL